MRTKIMRTVCKAVALSVTVGTMLASNGIVANAQPKEMKDGTVFDAEYYAQRYADVVAVYGTDEASLFQHYTDYGRAENREAVKAPSKATFDADYYASANPDVVAVYGTGSNNLYQHYLKYGKEEGRKPTANAKGDTSNVSSSTAKPAPASTEAPAQAKNISYEEAANFLSNYLNNLEANTPEYVREFFDSNGDHNIDGVEMGFLQAWMFDNYNPVDKSALDKDEVMAIVCAIQDGTFKLPSSLYYVTF